MSSEHTPVPVRQQLREARARVALRRLQAEEKLLEWWGGGMGPGGWPAPFDQPQGAVGPDGRLWLPVAGGRPDDRRDGANRPFVWTEIDLERARGVARWVATKNPLGVGVVESLTDYTVRTGYTYEAVPGRRYRSDAVARKLAAQVQEVLDEFQDLNIVGEGPEPYTWADREREAVSRDVTDGEVLLRTFDQGDGSTLVRFVEPEQVRQPLASPPEWSFGVRNVPGDVERPLAYAVSYDGPDDWEEVPARELAHLKSNVPSTVKRGLSDFYATAEALEEVGKLLRAMRVSGTAQAAIAWIEEHPGATQESLSALVAKTRSLNPPSYVDPVTGRDVSSQRGEPGQRLLVGGGRKYQGAPLAQNTTQHIAIVQASLRSVGARWRMTESMISGDASNNNMASQLIAGGPFVTRVECRQAIYGRYFVRVHWQAIANAARAGRFRVGGRVYAYEELSRLVDVTFTAPQVAISDKQAEAGIDHQDLLDGVTSLQRIRAKRGLDDEQVRKDLKEEPLTRVPGKVTDLDAEGNPVGKGGPAQAPAPGAATEAVREAKDDKGHEHARDGKFTGPGDQGSHDGKEPYAHHKDKAPSERTAAGKLAPGKDAPDVAAFKRQHAAWQKETGRLQQDYEQAQAQYEEDHAAWEKETAGRQQEYEGAHDAWEEAGKELEAKYERDHDAWAARGDERDRQGQDLESDLVGDATRASKSRPDPDPAANDGDAYLEGVREWGRDWLSLWDEAYGEGGKLAKALQGAGADETQVASVLAVAGRGRVALERQAGKLEKLAVKRKEALEWAAVLAGKVPPEPEGYDDGVPGDEDRYDREFALWEKANERADTAQEKAEELDSRADEEAQELEDVVYPEQDAKLRGAVDRVAATVRKRLEREEKADPEPQFDEEHYPTPPEPQEPDELEEPEEPEEPDYPDEPERPVREGLELAEGEDDMGHEHGEHGRFAPKGQDGSSAGDDGHHPLGAGVRGDQPLSAGHAEQLGQAATSRARRILGAVTSLPGRLVPQKVRDVAARVKEAAVGRLRQRYGDRAAGLIIKAAVLSAPIPLPGSQPLAIALCLVVAEAARAVGRLRGATPAPATEAREEELTADQVHAAAGELLADLEGALKDELGRLLRDGAGG